MLSAFLLVLTLGLLPCLTSAAVQFTLYNEANCTTWYAAMGFDINGTSFSPPCSSSPSYSEFLDCTVHGSPPKNYSSLSYKTWAQADCRGTLRSSYITQGSTTGCSQMVHTYKGEAFYTWATVDCNSTFPKEERNRDMGGKWILRTADGKGLEVEEEAMSDAVQQQRMMEE